ncbi:MAG: hypothetical protein ACYTGH_02995 [Planctomycetota bacterium]|jgi:hypothetical protein
MSQNETTAQDSFSEDDDQAASTFFSELATQGQPPNHSHTPLWAASQENFDAQAEGTAEAAAVAVEVPGSASSRRRRKIASYAKDVGFDFEDDEEGEEEYEYEEEGEPEWEASTVDAFPPSQAGTATADDNDEKTISTSSIDATEILQADELVGFQMESRTQFHEPEEALDQTQPLPTLEASNQLEATRIEAPPEEVEDAWGESAAPALPSLELDLNENAEDRYDTPPLPEDDPTTAMTEVIPAAERKDLPSFDSDFDLDLPEDGDFGVEGILPDTDDGSDTRIQAVPESLLSDEDELDDIMSAFAASSEEALTEEDWQIPREESIDTGFLDQAGDLLRGESAEDLGALASPTPFDEDEDDGWGDAAFKLPEDEGEMSATANLPQALSEELPQQIDSQLIGGDSIEDLFNHPDFHAPPDSEERQPGPASSADIANEIPDSFIADFDMPSTDPGEIEPEEGPRPDESLGISLDEIGLNPAADSVEMAAVGDEDMGAPSSHPIEMEDAPLEEEKGSSELDELLAAGADLNGDELDATVADAEAELADFSAALEEEPALSESDEDFSDDLLSASNDEFPEGALPETMEAMPDTPQDSRLTVDEEELGNLLAEFGDELETGEDLGEEATLEEDLGDITAEDGADPSVPLPEESAQLDLAGLMEGGSEENFGEPDDLSLTSIIESTSIEDALSDSLEDMGELPELPDEEATEAPEDDLLSSQDEITDIMGEAEAEDAAANDSDAGSDLGDLPELSEEGGGGDDSDIASLLAGAMDEDGDSAEGDPWGGGGDDGNSDMSAFLDAFDDSDDITGSAADIIAAPDFLERLFPKDSPAFVALDQARSVLFGIGRIIDGVINWTGNWRLYLTMASIAIITICTAIWVGAGLDNTGLDQ